MSLNINSYDSNSINTLFSGLNNSSRRTSGFTGMEAMLADYSSLKTGSYGKLLKSYYSKVDVADKKEGIKDKNTSEYSSVKKDAENLSKATETLLDKSSKSVWNMVSKTDEDGNTTKEYDKDLIYSSVNKFVDAYNDLVDSGQKSNNTGILTQVASMVTGSNSTHATLGQVGITIDTKGHLAVDEDFFKNKADMNIAKSLFNGTGSYLYNVATKASMVNSYASTKLADMTGNKMYKNNGNYSISSSDLVSSFNKLF